MFLNLRKIFSAALFSLVVFTSASNAAEPPLKVVATQTLFADIVKKVGGEKVNVTAVVPPKFNVHFYEPRPSDVRRMAKADLVVFAGLDLEAWFDPLVEAAGRPEFFRGRERCLDLSQGIRLLNIPARPLSRAEGDIHLFGNPHYHMNPENVKIMAGNILKKLKEIDPSNEAYYEENAKTFIAQLDSKVLEWKSLCAHCRGAEIVSYHDDIAYFADFLGLEAHQFLEPKPGIPPTPRHLQWLENYVTDKKVRAVVMPTYFPKNAAEALAGRMNARVVMVCQNAGEVPGTEDALEFFDYNVRQIAEALK